VVDTFGSKGAGMNRMKALEKMLKSNGASLIGFSNVHSVPIETRAFLPSAVTIAVALDKEVVRSIQGAPTRIYYEEYKRVNELLDKLGAKCADYLKDAGYKAVALPTTEVKSNKALMTDFPHKTGAILSGMGWIGKCALLITKEFGSALRLTTVFTDMSVQNGEMMVSLCGRCTQCMDACPGNAVKGKKWEFGTPRRELYDAFACQAAARAQGEKIGVKNTVCGVCIASCPWTKWYLK
jgi:epoxyqueuosine reductase